MLEFISGERLRALRKRSRLSLAQAVQLSGISEATILYLEQGKRKPQTRTLEKLLSLYAVRIQYWKNMEAVFREDK